MQTPRLRKYLKNRKNNPISQKEEIATNPDNKIDQDFSGFPHGNSKEESINPKTKNEKKTADINKKDGEKMMGKPTKTPKPD
jgi:hypothetical protein